jgi:hypothetical protein
VRYLLLTLLMAVMLALIAATVIAEINLVDEASAAVFSNAAPTAMPGCLYNDPSPAASEACGFQALQLAQAVTATPELPPGCSYYDKAYPLPDTCGLPPPTPTALRNP